MVYKVNFASSVCTGLLSTYYFHVRRNSDLFQKFLSQFILCVTSCLITLLLDPNMIFALLYVSHLVEISTNVLAQKPNISVNYNLDFNSLKWNFCAKSPNGLPKQ